MRKINYKAGDTIRYTGKNRVVRLGLVEAIGDDSIFADIEITNPSDWGNAYTYIYDNQVIGILEEELKSLNGLGSM